MKTVFQSQALIVRVLRITGATIPALAIIAYFSGWQYINQYFSEFGFNKSSLSFNDYTIFVYLFSVVTKIPSMIASFNLELLKALGCTFLLCLGPLFVERMPKGIPRLIVLRVWVWLLLILSLFFVSQEAGRIDANKVFNREARRVNLFFTDSFKSNLAANEGEKWAQRRIESFRKAARNGAVALIWRNSEETALLLFGTDGALHGKPLEIFRIDNSQIAAISKKAPNKLSLE